MLYSTPNKVLEDYEVFEMKSIWDVYKGMVFFLVICLLCTASASAQFDTPFSSAVEIIEEEGARILRVELEIPADTYIYAGKFAVEAASPARLEAVEVPESKVKYDKYMEKDIEVYDSSFTADYRIVPQDIEALAVTVSYQGCGADICYPPEEESFELGASAAAGVDKQGKADASVPSSDSGGIEEQLEGFAEIGKASGYLDSGEFIDFLDAAESGELMSQSGDGQFAGHGVLMIVLLVLLGGIALNLTPCVLPMIPINIAIIGAGSQASSKLRGLLLGATYGLGIALAYGALGLLVVLTGARFGALNSSPWFNFGIAILFALLSLSMFGVFNIDLSRFQKGGAGNLERGRFATAFVLGLVAALLAGACVAPVVISVLLYSTTLYAEGNVAGILLPFLLGLGMALPWPFAGAGLSFLPKSGAWMEKVKYVFGIIILIAAVYYAKLGYDLLPAGDLEQGRATYAEQTEGDWFASFGPAVERARAEGKPIFIDFWAAWCKSCIKMDKTTFKDPQVVERLDDYVKLKLDADRKDAATAYALDRFVEVGLPTYVIIEQE